VLKRRAGLFAVLVVVVAGVGLCGWAQSGAVQTGSTAIPAPSLFATTWDDRSPFAAGLIESEQAILNGLPGASVYHLDLWIAEDLSHLTGAEEVCYTNRSDEPLQGIVFRLFANLLGASLTVNRVAVNGTAAYASLENARSVLWVGLPAELAPGERVVVRIDYALAIPTQATDHYGMLAFADGILALAHAYPMVAVHDQTGWHREIPPTYGDLVFAESSFFLVRVTAPVGLTLLASGVEIDRESEPGLQRVTYAAGPMRDLFLAASARFVTQSRELGDTTVTSYAPPESASQAQTILDYAVEALRVFGNRYGTYPFTEFDVVATSTLAFGIEYPGATALTLRLYGPPGTYASSLIEAVVVHEVAHQWFYSEVGNDQLNEPWLDEGLAQYATLVYMNDVHGPWSASGFRRSLEERWSRVGYEAIPIGLPVAAYTELEYGAIVYGRAPLFFETLAKTLGQDTFDRILYDYVQENAWGIATAAGFERLAQSECHCDLTDLFDEWVMPIASTAGAAR
jgi:aminopeptidase N